MGKTTKSRSQRKRWLIIAASIVVIAVVVAVIVWPRGPHHEISNEVQQNFNNSQVGKLVDDVVPNSQLVSAMVMPAGDRWWRLLGSYVPAYQLQNIRYTTLGKPTSFGWAVLNNKYANSVSYFGDPALVITYPSDTQAKTARDAIQNSLRSSLDAYSTYQLGNNVILSSVGTYPDVKFKLKNYKQSVQTDKLEKAYWHISWGNLNRYAKAVQTTDYEKTYDEILQESGLDLTVPDAQWDGVSTDGVNWHGENNTKSNKPVINPAKFNPGKIMTTIADTERTVFPRYPDGTVGDYGVVEERQSALGVYLSLSTKQTAVGSTLIQTDNKVLPAKKLAADSKYDAVVRVNPSALFQFLFRNVSDVTPLFGYHVMTVGLTHNSNYMDINFSYPFTVTDQG